MSFWLLLGIKTRLRDSREFILADGKTERLLDLCRQLHATSYWCGPRSRDYLEEWRFREASRYLEEAAAREPRDTRVLLWHAQMLACSGRLEGALKEIDRARALDFKQPALPAMRAGILYFSGRYEEAMNAFRRAIGTLGLALLAACWVLVMVPPAANQNAHYATAQRACNHLCFANCFTRRFGQRLIVRGAIFP